MEHETFGTRNPTYRAKALSASPCSPSPKVICLTAQEQMGIRLWGMPEDTFIVKIYLNGAPKQDDSPLHGQTKQGNIMSPITKLVWTINRRVHRRTVRKKKPKGKRNSTSNPCRRLQTTFTHQQCCSFSFTH